MNTNACRPSLTTEERFLGVVAHQQILKQHPDFCIELSKEQLDTIVGGTLTAKDIAYCKISVDFYRSRGYTCDAMKAEMLAYQKTLKAQGKAALAALSAEYLDYMLSIW